MSQMTPQNTAPTPYELATNAQIQQMELQTKLLKKQLVHARFASIVLVLVLAVAVAFTLYMRPRVNKMMNTVDSVYAMTQEITTLSSDLADLTEDISDTVNKLDIDSMNSILENMSDVSGVIKGTVDAMDVDALNTAIENMNEVVGNLNSVVSLLNSAADALKGLFGN